MGFTRKIVGYLHDYFLEPNKDGSINTVCYFPVYATRVDTASDPIIYIGKAPPGAAEASAVWQIQKIDTSAVSVVFADGDGYFDNIWNTRTTCTYI